MTDRVWSIKLADDPDQDHHYNSDRLVRMSVCPSSRPALTVSAVCRQAVETSPEWMMKIAQRFQKYKTKKDRPFAVKFQYGLGYETILLMDGAALPKNDDDPTPYYPVAIESVVAPAATEETPSLAAKRKEKYGVNSFGDESK